MTCSQEGGHKVGEASTSTLRTGAQNHGHAGGNLLFRPAREAPRAPQGQRGGTTTKLSSGSTGTVLAIMLALLATCDAVLCALALASGHGSDAGPNEVSGLLISALAGMGLAAIAFAAAFLVYQMLTMAPLRRAITSLWEIAYPGQPHPISALVGPGTLTRSLEKVTERVFKDHRRYIDMLLENRDHEIAQGTVLATLDAQREGIVGIDGSGHVAFANNAARPALTVEAAKCVGRAFSEVASDPRLVELVDPASAGSGNGSRQVKLTPAGSEQALEALVTHSPRAREGGVGCVLTVRHATE